MRKIKQLQERKDSKAGPDGSEVYCRTKESPAWYWENESTTTTDCGDKRSRADDSVEATEILVKAPPKRRKVESWNPGDTVFVDVATWYRSGDCPFPENEKWFCEGKVLRVTKKRYVLEFPCFDEKHTKSIFYLSLIHI